MTEEPAVVPPSHHASDSSTGLAPNVACALAYAFGVISGIILFFSEKHSRAVRFHAAQSLLVFGTLGTLLITLSTVLYATLPFGMRGLANALTALAVLGLLTLWVTLVISAFQGKHLKLPLVGALADKMADSEI